MEKKFFKSGFVAIIGRPNVGKSTLLNALLKDKVAIISSKPQTTRHKILGILTEENYQIVFLDTPGIFKPRYKLQEIMVDTAHSAIKDSDLIVFIVEPKPQDGNLSIIDFLKKIDKPVTLVINKIDLIKDKRILLPIVSEYSNLYNFKEIIPISALHLDGVDILLEKIVEYLPYGEQYYPADIISDRNERFFVQELIREKIFNLFGEEIPYAITVYVDEFKERKKGKDYIHATTYVEKKSQKKILIGKGGGALKKAGEMARKDIENFLQREVYLELWVKVRKNWRKDKRSLMEFGYTK